jgi:hypothetical protein
MGLGHMWRNAVETLEPPGVGKKQLVFVSLGVDILPHRVGMAPSVKDETGLFKLTAGGDMVVSALIGTGIGYDSGRRNYPLRERFWHVVLVQRVGGRGFGSGCCLRLFKVPMSC